MRVSDPDKSWPVKQVRRSGVTKIVEFLPLMCLQFAYRFHDPASAHRPSVADIRDVTFNGEPASPQLLAFKNGKTIFGHKVEELLLARDDTGMPKLARADVVSFLKVGIYPNLEAEAFPRRSPDSSRACETSLT